MSPQQVELALKKQRLQLKSAALRSEFAGHAMAFAPLFAIGDGSESEVIGSFEGDDTGDFLTAFEFQQRGLKAECEGRVRNDERLKNADAIHRVPQPREFGADRAAFSIDRMAADAAGFWLLREDFAARFAVAAFERFAKAHQWVLRCFQLPLPLGELGS